MSHQTLDEINAQIAELQKKAEMIKKQELEGVILVIKEKIAKYSLTAKDLGLDGGKKRKSEIPPKYKKDNDIWTGRGRPPKFIHDHLASGGKLDDLLINK